MTTANVQQVQPGTAECGNEENKGRFQTIVERTVAAGGTLQIGTWNEFNDIKELCEGEGGKYETAPRDGCGTTHRVTFCREGHNDEELVIEHHATN